MEWGGGGTLDYVWITKFKFKAEKRQFVNYESNTRTQHELGWQFPPDQKRAFEIPQNQD